MAGENKRPSAASNVKALVTQPAGLKIMVCGKSTAYYEVNFCHEIKLNNLKASIVEI